MRLYIKGRQPLGHLAERYAENGQTCFWSTIEGDTVCGMPYRKRVTII
ncbi:MAG: hypothetical protein SPL64_07780 [Bacteroidaceae bacterium]|nr:hypothetical protein [Bacteroidaceae bacterium]